MEGLGFRLREEAVLGTLTQDVLKSSEGDTDREIGATFDRQGRATRPVVDPRVSFRSAFLKPFRPLSRSTGEPCRQGSASSFRLSGGVLLSD